ncbi:hypothetical protein ACPCG0_13510 [Propionibacteriaceae bacterium Y1923]
MAILHRSTTLAAANVVAFACCLGVVTALPAWAGATRVVANVDAAHRQAPHIVLAQIKHTFTRDWWLSLAAAVLGVLGTASFLSVGVYLSGTTRIVGLAVLAVVYLLGAVLLANYVRAAGTLPMPATRAQVMTETMRRIVEYPGRAVGSTLLMLLCAPLWLVAPLAIAFGIILPIGLAHLVWRRIEVGVGDDDELWNDAREDSAGAGEDF